MNILDIMLRGKLIMVLNSETALQMLLNTREEGLESDIRQV